MASNNVDEYPNLTDKPKKRQYLGNAKEKAKKQRVSSHTTGENCHCKRYKCFEKVTELQRQTLISNFNEKFTTKDQQDAYLSTLIKVCDIKRRRPRAEAPSANPHNHTYLYCVRSKDDSARSDSVSEKMVCIKAFTSLFGITKQRVETIRKSLAVKGHPPQDGRGKHGNRPHRISDDVKQAVLDHIKMFKGRTSHCIRGRSPRLYLPQDLNITKMYDLFTKANPEIIIGYETYRSLLNANFNISFGHQSKDSAIKHTADTLDDDITILWFKKS